MLLLLGLWACQQPQKKQPSPAAFEFKEKLSDYGFSKESWRN